MENFSPCAQTGGRPFCRLNGRASCGAVSARCTRAFTSTREPSRLRIDVRRSMVNRPRSAWQMREKPAGEIPVRPCAARTVGRSRSSALTISAARMALNCSAPAFLCPRSRNACRFLALLPAFDFSSRHLLQYFPAFFSAASIVASGSTRDSGASSSGTAP